MSLVLVLRPDPGATAARLRALGHQPVPAPLFAIRPIAADLPPPASVQAVLVTSRHALPALGAYHTRPLLAVGDATAAAARAAGFADIASAGRDAAALAALAGARCVPAGGALLIAAGADQPPALEAALRAAGFAVIHCVVYAAEPVTALPMTARTALDSGRLAAVLVHSPAAARLFTALLGAAPRPDLARVLAVAISPAAAAPLAPLPFRAIRVASAPTEEALLALLTA